MEWGETLDTPAKLLKPGVIELQWPIKRKAEDIPID